MLTVAGLLLILMSVSVSGVTLRGNVNLNAVVQTRTDIVDPLTVVIAGSTLGPTTIGGTVLGSSLTFLSCVFANITFTSLVNTSRITLTKCTVGDQFLPANLLSTQDWLYAAPTTAMYFSSPVVWSTVSITDSSVYASARGVHFASTVQDSAITLLRCAASTQCLNITTLSLTAETPTCANVFALSSDYLIVRSQLVVNTTTIATESDFGGANALYFVQLGSASSVFIYNVTVSTNANDDRCLTGNAPLSSVATGLRVLSATAAVVSLTNSRFVAFSNATCIAFGVTTGTWAKGSLTVFNSSVEASSFAASQVAAVTLGTSTLVTFSVTWSKLICTPSPNCIAVVFAALTAANLDVRNNGNVTSTGHCFAFTSPALTSVLLFDTNTMFCAVLFIKTPSSWGPFAPPSYFVGRCNKASGTEVVAATLPALVPSQMTTVSCSACNIALDCNAPSTLLVTGTAGACSCGCKQTYLNTLVFHRKAIDSRCLFVSITHSKSRSLTSTVTKTPNITGTKSSSTSRATVTRSASPPKSWTISATISMLITKTPTRTRTLRITKTFTASQTPIYIPPPSVVLAQSITNRVPDALVYSAVAASALAGLFSPTLSNKASTISRILFSIDCFESADRYKPIFFLDAFAIGSDATKRLLGASVFASAIAAASMAFAHTVYSLSTGPSDLALGRRLAGHVFAFCFTLFVPFAAEYASTSLSHSSSGRPIAVVILLLVLTIFSFALFYVAWRFPRRRSRPRTLAMRKYKEEKALRHRTGRPMPEQGGDPITLPCDVPYIDERTILNVEQNSDEDRADEARWSRVLVEEEQAELNRRRHRTAETDPKKEEEARTRRKRRQERHRKRQKHWSVWHTRSFTSTLYGVFFEARDYRVLKVRLYYFEDWWAMVLISTVSGILPGSRGCGAITILTALICAAHTAYLFAVRPFRQFVSAALSMLMATGMLALSVACYFATTSTDLIDIAVQIAVVLTGVLVAHVCLVGASATFRFFRRATSSEEKIGSDEDSEEVEAKRAAAELQRLSLAKLLSGADDDSSGGLLHLERVTTQMRGEVTSTDLLFYGNEERFGQGIPPPPDSEADGDIDDEDPEARRRRIRMQYPHYVERPLCSHEDSAARFLEMIRTRKSTSGASSKSRSTLVGGRLGFVPSRLPGGHGESSGDTTLPLISPLLLLDDENTNRWGRPKPLTDEDFEVAAATILKERHYSSTDSSKSATSSGAEATTEKDKKAKAARQKDRRKRKARNRKVTERVEEAKSSGGGFSSIFHAKHRVPKKGEIRADIKKVSDTKKKPVEPHAQNPIDASKFKLAPTSRYVAVSTRPHNVLLEEL